jgi:hypothetical protein
MTPPLTDPEFDELLAQMFAEGLTDDQRRALEATIAADSAAMVRYVETVHLRESLPYLLGESKTEGPASEPETEFAAHGDLAGAAETSVRPADGSDLRSRGRGSLAAARPVESWNLPPWATAASIAFVAGAALAVGAYRGLAPGASGAGSEPRLMHAASSDVGRMAARDAALGRVAGLSLEASADGLFEAMQVGQPLRWGEVVQLVKGHMRVVLNSGPEFIVEGPAEFSLTSANCVFLRTGRMSARGTQELVVQTPLLTAECRAADLCFEAADDDSASIYVHEGVATLLTTPREGVSSEPLQTLHRQEGALVERPPGAGSRTITARGPIAGVARSWEEIESRLTRYQRAVLADRPVAYWPLYRVQKNRRVLDLTQNGHDGWPIGNWPEAPGNAEPGAYYNGESYIEPDRKPPIDPRTGFTVEGWARVEGQSSFQSVFTSRWVLKSHEPDCQMFGFTLYAGEGNQWEFWTGSGRRGELWQRLVSDAPVERGRWTYVVASFTPGEQATVDDVEGVVRLYVNGDLVDQGTHRESLTDFEWPARIGAAEYVPRYLTSWLFKGHLRDIAVYGYPLAEGRIAEHFAAGRVASNRTAVSHGFRSHALLAVATGGVAR